MGRRTTPDATRKRGRRLFNAEEEQKLLKMHEEGYSSEYIAVSMDCSTSTVFNYLRRLKAEGGAN